MILRTLAARRRPDLAAAEDRMRAAGVMLLETRFVDLAGTLRTKTGRLRLDPDGEAFNPMLLATARGEGEPNGEPLFPSPFAGIETGFANALALADPATIRHHKWAPETASVFVDLFLADGSPSPLDVRAPLKRQEERALRLGFEPRFAVELEFGLFEADPALMKAGRFGELTPWGASPANYDAARAPGQAAFVARLAERLSALGIGMASFVSEYGRGLYEIALTPTSALEAADDLARTKLILRALAAEHGLVATFMARVRPPGRESGCGAHIHQSLWRDGANAFAAAGELTPLALSFAAGQIATLAETHLLFRPTMNSYRRLDLEAWSPETASFGVENRMAAIRGIPGAAPHHARLEHRAAGADANLHLVLAALLAAGLDGIEAELPPPPAASGPPRGTDFPPLSRTLAASIEAFAGSAFAEGVFGADLTRHYADAARFEAEAFERWLDSHITDFEWRRYFL